MAENLGLENLSLEDTTFPFITLPLELRLLVYDNLTYMYSPYRLLFSSGRRNAYWRQYSVPTSALLICKCITEEIQDWLGSQRKFSPTILCNSYMWAWIMEVIVNWMAGAMYSGASYLRAGYTGLLHTAIRTVVQKFQAFRFNGFGGNRPTVEMVNRFRVFVEAFVYSLRTRQRISSQQQTQLRIIYDPSTAGDNFSSDQVSIDSLTDPSAICLRLTLLAPPGVGIPTSGWVRDRLDRGVATWDTTTSEEMRLCG